MSFIVGVYSVVYLVWGWFIYYLRFVIMMRENCWTICFEVVFYFDDESSLLAFVCVGPYFEKTFGILFKFYVDLYPI